MFAGGEQDITSKGQSRGKGKGKGRRRAMRIGLAGLGFLLFSDCAVIAALPQVVNHYGVALPSDSPAGLPYRVYHQYRTYASADVCANAGWCSHKPVCLSEPAAIRATQVTPQLAPSGDGSGQSSGINLVEVGSVSTLFGLGPTYSVVAPLPEAYESGTAGQQAPESPLPFAVYVRYRDDCYIDYGILGEP